MVKPVKVCSVAHCNTRCHGWGFCEKHYRAFRLYGDPLKLKQKQHHGLTLEERFNIYTKKGPDCWEWKGYRDPHGYGRLDMPDKPMLAHRVAYLIRYGSIPDGMFVLHKCDTPRCVNPEHLFLGTQADNVADMHAKGRARKRALRGPEHGMAKLDERKVRAIRKSRLFGWVIAEKLGISVATVSDIRTRKTWKHIE